MRFGRLAAVAVLMLASLGGCTPSAPSLSGPGIFPGGVPVTEEHVLAPNDELEVRFPFYADLNDRVLVGPDGRRMFSETTVPYGGTHARVTAVGGRVFVLFDARTRADNGTAGLPTFKVQFDGQQKPAKVWSPEGIERKIAEGAIVDAETLEELARKLGLPAAALLRTVERYNQSAALGIVAAPPDDGAHRCLDLGAVRLAATVQASCQFQSADIRAHA